MKIYLLAVCLCLTAIFTSQANADVVVLFDFDNGGVAGATPAGAFDAGGGLRDNGLVVTVDSLALTLVDIFAPDFDATPDGPAPFVLNGDTLSAAAGDGGLEVNINGSDSLGVANPAIPNGFIGAETDLFNIGEGITFTFDSAVVFTAIELESVQSGGIDQFSVSVDGLEVISGVATEGFQDLSGLAGLEVAAGSEVTFAVDGDLASTSVGIETFTVEVVPAVPEPSSLALLGLGAMAICARRKRG